MGTAGSVWDAPIDMVDLQILAFHAIPDLLQLVRPRELAELKMTEN